ncbi:MAG TPA: hypothetical protein VL418_07645 [Devosiaceae bacterium]|nr:hypothetical protein [Devosiaceae bacterium]
MKSVMIAAALCAAFCLVTPATAAAAKTVKGPTDVQIYCTFFSWTAKCATPAKPTGLAVAKAANAKPVIKVASIKPAAKPGIKTMACVPAAKGAGHLYDCTWK